MVIKDRQKTIPNYTGLSKPVIRSNLNKIETEPDMVLQDVKKVIKHNNTKRKPGVWQAWLNLYLFYFEAWCINACLVCVSVVNFY